MLLFLHSLMSLWSIPVDREAINLSLAIFEMILESIFSWAKHDLASQSFALEALSTSSFPRNLSLKPRKCFLKNDCAERSVSKKPTVGFAMRKESGLPRKTLLGTLRLNL